MARILSPEAAAKFWHRQFLDHLRYTHDLVNDAAVRRRCKSLYETHRRKPATPAWTQALAHDALGVHLPLEKRLFAGHQLGPMFPSLVHHMIREEKWLLGCLGDKWDLRDLVSMASIDTHEAAGLVSKLTDPKSDAFSKKMAEWSAEYGDIHGRSRRGAVGPLARAYADDTDAFLKYVGAHAPHALKVITMDMIEHDGREAKHYAALLRKSER